MDAERAEGIVLRVRPVTESSLLVTWFTKEFGRLKTLAKGARRPKSPLRGRLDLFYQDEIVFLRSPRSDLHLLRDCFLECPHLALQANWPALMAGSYICELVDVFFALEDPYPLVYELLADSLARFGEQPTIAQVIWFELQLLRAAGWRQQISRDTAVGRLLFSIESATAVGIPRIRLSPAQAGELLKELGRFREDHLGRSLRSERSLLGQLQH